MSNVPKSMATILVTPSLSRAPSRLPAQKIILPSLLSENSQMESNGQEIPKMKEWKTNVIINYN